MTQNGNIYRLLTQTVTCPLPRYRSKHLTGNSQWISQTTNSLTALLTKKAQVRFREVINTSTERRAEKCIQWTVWILSHVLRTTLCEHVNGLCPAGWLNEQSITKHWFQSICTCPYSWATGCNSSNFLLQYFANEHWVDYTSYFLYSQILAKSCVEKAVSNVHQHACSTFNTLQCTLLYECK